MIPVETVLRKLIVEFEFVILPGFGALLCHHIPATYDSDAGVFSPPMKKLAFNESLKLDDGLLANFISRHEQIPHQDAVMYIRNYIEKLWAQLESRGEARIIGIGRFGKNVEGRLVFDPGKESHFKDEWYGFANVSARLAKPVQNTRVVNVREKELVEEAVEFVEEERAPGKAWRWVAAAALIGVIGYFSVFFVSGNLENKSSLNPFSSLFEKTTAESVAPKVDAIAAQEESGAEVKGVSTASLPEEVKEEVVAEVTAIEPVQEAQVQTNGQFFVIAGAFKGSRQANVLLEQLKKKGFDKATLIPADADNSKVKVSVGSYGSESEAYDASRNLKSVIGEVGWVYKQK